MKKNLIEVVTRAGRIIIPKDRYRHYDYIVDPTRILPIDERNITQEDIFLEGASAADNGIFLNPYSDGSPEARNWEEGFNSVDRPFKI